MYRYHLRLFFLVFLVFLDFLAFLDLLANAIASGYIFPAAANAATRSLGDIELY